MTTHVSADTTDMEASLDHNAGDEPRMPEAAPHEPPSRRHEGAEAHAARVAAIARAVHNGSYDTEVRTRLGADALFQALVDGRRPSRS